MNALAANHDFAVIAGPASEWLVLLCQSSRTLALAAALADYGAWTPTWKRKRRMPRSPISRIVTEPCIPGMAFIPALVAFGLPEPGMVTGEGEERRVVPGYSFMRGAEFELIRVPDRQLEPMRRIADKPLIAASKLPKAGQRVRFTEGPWEGLRGKVLGCTIRYCSVVVEGFAQAIQAPPMLLAVD